MAKNVILYRRVSTDEQATNNSLSLQKVALEKYCEIKCYNILGDFEEDYSAKTFERPEWRKLLEFIKLNKNKVDAVAFLRWDRFSRNAEQAMGEIRKLNKLGVEVCSIEQPLDMSVPENKVMLTIFLTMAEVENDKNSIRTTEGSRRARLDGCWTGTPPFGYSNYRDENNKSTLLPNKYAPIVVEIFDEMAKGGRSADSIRKEYNGKGYKFVKQTFLDMLRNVAYIGKITVKKYKNEPEEEATGLHKPIVSETTFYKVQNLLNSKKRPFRSIVAKNDLYPLKRVLICPKCSGCLVAYKARNNQGKHYHYYECQKCGIRDRVETIHDNFNSYLKSLQINEEVVTLYLKIIEDSYIKADKNRTAEMSRQIELIASYDKKITGIQNKFANDDIDAMEYREIKKRLVGEQSDIVKKLAELKMQKTPFKQYLQYATKFLPNIEKFYAESDSETKYRIASSIFPENLIFQNNTFRTNRINSLIQVMTRTENGFNGRKVKQAGINSDLSTSAPPPRLERGTP